MKFFATAQLAFALTLVQGVLSQDADLLSKSAILNAYRAQFFILTYHRQTHCVLHPQPSRTSTSPLSLILSSSMTAALSAQSSTGHVVQLSSPR